MRLRDIASSDLIERFWSQVDRRRDDDCWEWLGDTWPKSGYGKFDLAGTTTNASRAAYLIATGNVRDDRVVCHTCDRRRCCNPKHLWEDTQKRNMEDKVAKNRHRWRAQPGEHNGRARLRASDVLVIRRYFQRGVATKTELARLYHVGVSTIYCATNYRSWKHTR